MMKKMDMRNGAVLEVNHRRLMKFGKETGSNYGSHDELKKPSSSSSGLILESDAPELVLFLQESKYHFVTDISMDAATAADHQLNPENKQRLLFKSAKWSGNSSPSLTLDLQQDTQIKQIHPDEPVLLHSHHHTRNHKGVKVVNSEAVSGSSSSMGGFSGYQENGGYISDAASSMHRSNSLATMSSSSRKGRSRSSVDDIRFSVSDFSASFWGPVGRSAAMRAFSGDVSLSSTSSNASAHSFAFPVLPAEWNGSPVRMAVADPRQLRKQRSWKTSLLCCRF